ncbi:hypothetical protein IJZ97_03600, partial [bacterium]|nr:hypothetical protein [bacterium]
MRINSISTPAFSAQFAKDENTKSILREYATIDKSPELYKTMQLLKEIGKDGEISLNKNKYGVIVANSSITNKDVPIGTDLFALKDYTYKYKEYAQHSRLFGNDAVNIREKNKDGSVYRRIEQNLNKGSETGLLKTSIAIHDEDISS